VEGQSEMEGVGRRSQKVRIGKGVEELWGRGCNAYDLETGAKGLKWAEEGSGKMVGKD